MDMYLTCITNDVQLQLDLSREFESLERWHGCVQLQGDVLGTQGNQHIVMFIYALTVMCLWKYDARDYITKDIAMKY